MSLENVGLYSLSVIQFSSAWMLTPEYSRCRGQHVWEINLWFISDLHPFHLTPFFPSKHTRTPPPHTYTLTFFVWTYPPPASSLDFPFSLPLNDALNPTEWKAYDWHQDENPLGRGEWMVGWTVMFSASWNGLSAHDMTRRITLM